ncbi:MAG: fibronectin type III domain-containing protein [Desulfobulbaceae bacterium]|nr:fibronectin type III domain-containing protein [Desulfobulbaceae bacterium]
MKSRHKTLLLTVLCLLSLTLSPPTQAEAQTFTINAQGPNAAKIISAGGNSSAALTNQGTIIPWGNNLYGQNTVPTELTQVTALSVGGYHLLALTSDGMVTAWGNDLFDQSKVPVGLSGVQAISAGLYHSVALKTDGTVVAWGRNDQQQSAVPATLNGVMGIAAGGYHTVVLKNDGTVVAWGDSANPYGQSIVPPNLSGVIAIAAGALHTVALQADGTVVAWGDNTFGQCTVPAGLTGVTAIAAGTGHTVALKGDGTVVAWGDNYYGQTTAPGGLTEVTAIAAGNNHTLALKRDGSVIAWGDTRDTQSSIPSALNNAIMDGTLSCSSPVESAANSTCTITPGTGYHLATFTVNGIDHLADVVNNSYTIANILDHQTVVASFALTTVPGAPSIGTATAARNRATVTFTPPSASGGSPITGYIVTSEPDGISATGTASPITVGGLTNGTPYTFTVRATNGIGTGASSTDSNSVIPLITHLVRVQGLGGVSAIAAGGRHTVVSKNDGTVATWGDNSDGQTSVPPALTGIKTISAGDAHTVALKRDGTVVAWGDNGFGQTSVPTGLSGVTAIASGWYHSLALRSDGTVVAWGDDDYGQATVPPGLSGVKAIAAGANLSVAIKNDATVIAWGQNGPMQTTTLTAVAGLATVAPGWAHTVALQDSGAVLSWGSTLYGLSTVPAGLSWATAIAAGYLHSVALKDDGTVVAWGKNLEGQASVPPGLAGIAAISAGDNHTVALKNDGTVTAWGDNGYGQTDTPASLSGEIANGVIICTSPVQDTLSSTCNMSADPGYFLSVFSINGVNKLNEVSNGSYTINNIEAEQTVVAAFATVPGAPTIRSALSNNGQAIISFVAPSSDGGSPVTNYAVTASPGGLVSFATSSPIVVSGLPLGIRYTFSITASNIFGVGPASAPSNQVLVYEPSSMDFDADTIGNTADNCPFVSNTNQNDGDYDGVGDECDPFPANVSEWRDTDGDGIGDNSDNCMAVANPSQVDSDMDARGDACDSDPRPNFGTVIDAPHNQTYGISCADCHSFSLWWQYAPLAADGSAFESATNAICSKCHGPGGPATQVTGHLSAVPGVWQTKCVDCHDPHLQAQLHWASIPTDAAKLFLATGIVGDSIVVSQGETTFSYTPLSALPEWSNPLLWQRKNSHLPPNGLILVDNKDTTTNNTFKVLRADAGTITVKGGIDPGLQGKTFGIIYGQMIRPSIWTTSLESRDVKFFNPKDANGGFTDTNLPATGICQVCHINTAHWTSDGGNTNHNNGTDCSTCHAMANGFKKP